MSDAFHLDYQYLQQIPTFEMCEYQDFIGKPACISNLMQSWRAYGTWTPEYFDSNFGAWSISADRICNGKKEYVHLPLSDYLNYWQGTCHENPYYGKTSLHLFSNLNEDYSVPKEFECWYKRYNDENNEQHKADLSWIYFGPKNAQSALHTDLLGSSYWNALISGKKLWIFIENEQEHLTYDGKVNPFDPDLTSFPDYEFVAPSYYIQKPGEVIYCPSNVWHAVKVLEPSIALTENFINAENYLQVTEYLKKRQSFNALEKMVKVVSFNSN